MATQEQMILCEGEDIEEKVAYAEDLVDFLVEQVGSANVDKALNTPAPAPEDSTLMSRRRSLPSSARRSMSSPGSQPECFHIGDVEKPLESKELIKHRHSMTSAENTKLFFIGDLKAVKNRRHSTKTFFIGEGKACKPKGSSRRHTLAHSEIVAIYPSPRIVCKNLLADDSDASTTYSESGSPEADFDTTPRADFSTSVKTRTEAEITPDYRTPVKRLLDFTRIAPAQPVQDAIWKNWGCVLGCGVRDRD